MYEFFLEVLVGVNISNYIIGYFNKPREVATLSITPECYYKFSINSRGQKLVEKQEGYMAFSLPLLVL